MPYRASSTSECPRAPAAEPGTPGPTINRSGTENDQWLTTVYDYGSRCSRSVLARSYEFTEQTVEVQGSALLYCTHDEADCRVDEHHGHPAADGRDPSIVKAREKQPTLPPREVF